MSLNSSVISVACMGLRAGFVSVALMSEYSRVLLVSNTPSW